MNDHRHHVEGLHLLRLFRDSVRYVRTDAEKEMLADRAESLLRIERDTGVFSAAWTGHIYGSGFGGALRCRKCNKRYERGDLPGELGCNG